MVLNVNGLNVSMLNVTKCKLHKRNPLLKGIKRRFITSKVYGLLQAFFIEGDPHSYTRHIERVDRGERDIVPSAQD